MRTRDFYFDLPPELIAQRPVRRGSSRLLVYSREKGITNHANVRNLPDYLNPESLIVLNNSSVRRARVHAQSSTGSRVEFVFLQPLDDCHRPLNQELPSRYWQVMVSRAKRQSPGREYTLPGNLQGEITAADETLRVLRLSRSVGEAYFNAHGHVPLPPYIQRNDNAADRKRYQTVFASRLGSVAAPTAGLHINNTLLRRLRRWGIQCCEITLHVGLGTFLPVRSEQITDHTMHSEEYEIDEETAMRITGA